MNKYYVHASRIAISVMAASMLLTACSNAKQTDNETAAAPQQATTASTAGEGKTSAAESAPNERPDDSEADVNLIAEADATAGVDAEPIASIPEKDIYLYPDKTEGVLLRVGEHEQHFDWTYDTPRMIMPELQLGDMDGDGEDELAVVLYVGSGTGLSISELRIVEGIGAENGSAAPYTEHVFAEEDYLAQLDQALSFKKAMKGEELFGQITVGGQTHEVSLSDYEKEYGEERIENRLGFGAIIRYEANNGGLAFSAAVGLVIDGLAEPQYIGTVEADVAYKSGKFKLTNFRYRLDA